MNIHRKIQTIVRSTLLVALLLVPSFGFAVSPLQVDPGNLTGVLVNNSTGALVPMQTVLDNGLEQGWIIRTANEPVTLQSPVGAVVIGPSSMIGIQSLSADNPSFYLVDGSASFQTQPDFSKTLHVATPVSRYTATGASDIYVLSTDAELVYSFAGTVDAYNVITNNRTTVPSMTYLDMMIPTMGPKDVSAAMYAALATAPRQTEATEVPATPAVESIAVPGAPTLTIGSITEVASTPKTIVEEPVVVVVPTPTHVYPQRVAPVKVVKPTTTTTTVVSQPQPVPVKEVAPVPAAPNSLVQSVEAEPAQPSVAPVVETPVVIEEATPVAEAILIPSAPSAVVFTLKPFHEEVATVVEEVPVIEAVSEASAMPEETTVVVETSEVAAVPEETSLVVEPAGITDTPEAATELEIKEPEPLTVADQKLTVRQATTPIISGTAPKKTRLDGGVGFEYRLSYNGSQVTTTGSTLKTPLSTIAIKPYLSLNSLKLGLTVNVATTGSLKWDGLQGNIKFDTSSPLATTASVFKFIDFFKFGTLSSKAYFNVDTVSSISFGKDSVVATLDPTFQDTTRLGFYHQVNVGWYSHQLFFDDLYLTNLQNTSNPQVGGLRIAFTPSSKYPFSIGLSSLASMSIASGEFKMNLYPSLDLIFPLVNTRQLRMNLTLAAATYLPVLPSVDVKQIYNNNGTTLGERIPNVLAGGGIDAAFGNFKIGAFVALNHGVVRTDLVNNTHFSGYPLTFSDAMDMKFTFSYTAPEGLRLNASWNLPLSFEGDLHLAPFFLNPTRSADVASISIGYAGKAWTFGVGVQQIDPIGAYKNLFTSSDTLTKRFSDFMDPNYTNVFASLSYDAGAAKLGMKLSTTDAGVGLTDFNVAPVLDLSMMLRLGSSAVHEYGAAEKLTAPKNVQVSGSLGATFANRYFGSTTPDKTKAEQVLFIHPTLDISSPYFSMGIGVNFGMNLGYTTFFDPAAWYAPRGNRFWDFGFIDNNGTQVRPIADLVFDIFGLIEYMRIGQSSSVFSLTMDRHAPLTFGNSDLVTQIIPDLESPFFTSLALHNKLTTKYFGYELFIDDLTFPTLAGLSLSITPVADAYPFTVSASTVMQTSPSYSPVDMMFYPEIEISLPFVYNVPGIELGLDINAASAASVQSAGTTAFLLLEQGKLKNYMLGATLDGNFNGFALQVAGGIQSGWLTHGMFDQFYMRNATSFTGSSSAERSLYAAASLGYANSLFSINTGYSATIAIQPWSLLTDKVSLGITVDSKYADLSLGFVRRNFSKDLTTIIGAKAGFVTSVKDLLLTADAISYLQLDIKAGFATLTGRVSTSAEYSNTGVASTTLKPTLALGMKISF